MNHKFRKGLVVGIIVLFIGVGVYPAFAVNINSINSKEIAFENDNDDLIEITIYDCKTDHLKYRTINITKNQVNDFKNLFKDFRKKQDKATTFKETFEIYIEMIEALDKIGLSPEYEYIKLKQQKIKEIYKKNYVEIFSKKYYFRNNETVPYDDNKLCLISGRTTNTILINPISLITTRIGDGLEDIGGIIQIFYELLGLLFNSNFLYYLYSFLYKCSDYFVNTLSYKLTAPINNKKGHFGCSIGLGGMNWNDPAGTPSAARGWVNTFGLKGKKNWTLMRGATEYAWYFGGIYYPTIKYEFYPGVNGFFGTGYHLNEECYYIGFASLAKIKIWH